MNEHVQTASSAPLFNPLNPEFIRNPYPHYERMRTTDPVHLTPLGVVCRQPPRRGQPRGARQAVRQGLRRAHHSPLRPQDHGRAGVPQHEPLDAAAGSAGPHPPARAGGKGLHRAPGRGHASAHPADRRRDARPHHPAGQDGPDRGFRVPPAGHHHLRHARNSPKSIARCFTPIRATADVCSIRCR